MNQIHLSGADVSMVSRHTHRGGSVSVGTEYPFAYKFKTWMHFRPPFLTIETSDCVERPFCDVNVGKDRDG